MSFHKQIIFACNFNSLCLLPELLTGRRLRIRFSGLVFWEGNRGEGDGWGNDEIFTGIWADEKNALACSRLATVVSI